MIIIKTTDIQSEIKIPVLYTKTSLSERYNIKLENTTTHVCNGFLNVIDNSTSPLYYTFYINTNTLDAGEYEYKVLEQSLLDDMEYEVASGLLRIELHEIDTKTNPTEVKTVAYKAQKSAYKAFKN